MKLWSLCQDKIRILQESGSFLVLIVHMISVGTLNHHKAWKILASQRLLEASEPGRCRLPVIPVLTLSLASWRGLVLWLLVSQLTYHPACEKHGEWDGGSVHPVSSTPWHDLPVWIKALLVTQVSLNAWKHSFVLCKPFWPSADQISQKLCIHREGYYNSSFNSQVLNSRNQLSSFSFVFLLVNI